MYEIIAAPDAGETQRAFDALYLLAFGPGYRARTAERLREGNRPRDALTHIARAKGALIGAVHFWPIRIGDAAALLLGPLAVAPEWQGQKIGLRLMQAAFTEVDRLDDIAGVLLVGDADYYARVGFAPLPVGSVTMPGPVDPERLLFRRQGQAALPCGIVRIA